MKMIISFIYIYEGMNDRMSMDGARQSADMFSHRPVFCVVFVGRVACDKNGYLNKQTTKQ